MTSVRLVLFCGLLASLPAAVHAQPEGATAPLRGSVSLGMSFTRDLTERHERMRGVSGGIDWPVGRGVWITVEAAGHRRQYERVSPGFAPRITRGGASIAARWGRVSGNGPFGRVAVGHFQQSVKGGASRDRSAYGVGALWWLAPGLGVDVKVSRRLAVRLLAEAQVLSERVRDRRVSTQLNAGVVYRFVLREK